MIVYHYTSAESLKRIKASGYIVESPLSDKDAFYGRGVYLTTLNPSEGRSRISDNNWGRYGQYMEDMGKADCAIKLDIPQGNLKRAMSGDRDIWVHQGDIVLRAYSHEFLEQGGWWCTIL